MKKVGQGINDYTPTAAKSIVYHIEAVYSFNSNDEISDAIERALDVLREAGAAELTSIVAVEEGFDDALAILNKKRNLLDSYQ